MLTLNFYKLVQFLTLYVNLKEIKILIMICLYIAQKWLYKLRYEYKNIYKDIFINRYK